MGPVVPRDPVDRDLEWWVFGVAPRHAVVDPRGAIVGFGWRLSPAVLAVRDAVVVRLETT
jgi:hypothetical protein